MIEFEDPLAKWKREADERTAAEQAETRRRIAEAKRDRRRRERDRVESAAVAELRAELETLREEIGARDSAFVSLAGLVETAGERLAELNDKLAKLEQLLASMRQLHDAERSQPMDLPPLRTWSRPVN